MNDKIKEQLFRKNLIYIYDASNDFFTIPIPVKKWGDNQLAFECPFCYSKYKKNGQPYKMGTHKLHFHGTGGEKDKDGNYGTRTPHCDNEARLYWDLPSYEFKLIGGNMIY